MIALGTTNQAKKRAVISATGMEPVCHSVPSGVSDQPLSEDETICGAINRAKNVLPLVPEATLGLGLEGGLTYDDVYTHQWYLLSVCAAWDGKQLFLGKGLSFPIPHHVGERIHLQQLELRVIIDELSGTVGSNHREGAYGLFTDGQITRTNVFRDAVLAAITPFQSSFYRKTD